MRNVSSAKDNCKKVNYFKLFFKKLKYFWFTMFLMYRKCDSVVCVCIGYIYIWYMFIYIYINILFLDYFPLYVILCIFPCAYSRSLLVIYHIYSSMLIPNSWFIPPHSPLVAISLFSVSMSLSVLSISSCISLKNS